MCGRLSFCLLNENNYLNFAETSLRADQSERASSNLMKQAVGSLVPLGCDGYPPATRGLATRWSTWDLARV